MWISVKEGERIETQLVDSSRVIGVFRLVISACCRPRPSLEIYDGNDERRQRYGIHVGNDVDYGVVEFPHPVDIFPCHRRIIFPLVSIHQPRFNKMPPMPGHRSQRLDILSRMRISFETLLRATSLATPPSPNVWADKIFCCMVHTSILIHKNE